MLAAMRTSGRCWLGVPLLQLDSLQSACACSARKAAGVNAVAGVGCTERDLH